MLTADKENSVLPTPSKLVMDENWDKTTVEKLKEEPLLITNEKRFVMFPIEYDQIWHAYKSTEARFWSAEEIELSDDINDWQELPQKEKALVLQILTLFVTNDSIIGTDIVKRFSMEIQAPEARSFFGFLMMQNNIHLELFNVIFEMYDKDHDTDILFDTIDQMPSTSKKSAWIASKLVESTAHYSTRLVSLAVYYRIFFAGSIALLMHFTKNTDKLFPGLVHSVGKMSRDYAKYADFCLLLIRHFQNKHSAQDAKSLVIDAVRMEFESVQQILANSAGVAPSLVGVDIVLMDLKGYLENMGNNLLVQMGHQKVFNVVGEPLNWVTASLDKIARLDDVEAGLAVSNSNSQVNKNATNSSAAPEFSLDEDF